MNLVSARVSAHKPPFGMMVSFKTLGQGPSLYVQLGRKYADALRISQEPLPTIGTWGIVAFPNDDIRNGVWLCSYLPSFLDALHAPGGATEPFIDYDAHWSGHWNLLDGEGNYAVQFVDGSFITVASGTTLPTIYRHTVNSSNERERVPFTRGERIPNPPAPRPMHIEHSSGTKITIAADGTVTIDLAGGKKLDITQAGAPAADHLTLVSKLLTAFNAHTHTGVTTGGGNSGPPTTLLTPANVQSDVVDISG